MKYFSALMIVTFYFVIASSAQNGTAVKSDTKAVTTSAELDSMIPAKAALAAHGGDKLRKMTSLLIKGSVDLNTFGQALPGTFSTAISGEKYYFEINSVQQLKQVYDGRETFSSIQGFSLPPVTSLGLPLLARVGDEGYKVTALPAKSKKKKGFRVTTPEGFYTDFGVDEKTGQIKSYESAFDLGGRIVTTSVEIDEFQTVEGVVIPKKYSQRFDLGSNLTAYANFKAKEILVNTKIDDSAFTIPR